MEMNKGKDSKMDYLMIRIEGFDQQELLSQCLKQNFNIRKVRISNHMVMTIVISGSDWDKFTRMFKNEYHLTIIKRYGMDPFLRNVFSKKSILVGLIIIAFLLVYQGMFISEIRIYGYEAITEEQLRAELREAGLFEGARKSLDPNIVEIEIFKKHDDISWIGIEYIGTLAEVHVVEKRVVTPIKDEFYPCHIIAGKDGYVQSVIPREGLQAVEKGSFVKEGDIVITGMIPVMDTTYSNDSENGKEYRYVHAEGEILAKTIYRHVIYQEAKKTIKTPTGRRIPGITLILGDMNFDSNRFFNPYEASVVIGKDLLDKVRPVPIKLRVTMLEEVELSLRKRSKKSIEAMAKEQIRWILKDNLPEKAQIVNNSLKFSVEENIIVVTVITEALEEIGLESPITIITEDEEIESNV